MFDIRRVIERIKKTPLRLAGFGGQADRILLVGLLVVAVLTVFVAAVLPRFLFRDGGTSVPNEQEEVVLYRHPLTGLPVSEVVAAPQVFSVMVDNHEEAWPPSGIEQAFLVIEAPVEAGIPRMLAFFTQEQTVSRIGPVRSARSYFLDWASELDALYAHVGGSNQALDLIASGETFDINEYWWGDYFWRATDRYAPHDVYTSTERLNAFYSMREEAGVAPTRLYDIWTFKDPRPSNEESRLYIDFWAPVYVVDWEYDRESGRYLRSQFREPHVAQSGTQIAADNVAVVVTDIEVIDNVGRREIRTTGEGEGYVLQDGRVIEATWKKSSKSERLKFYDRATDEEIVMNAGMTWIEVVGSEEDIRIE